MAETLTPMMQQFRAAKEQHLGMVVLFRNGDFYELFEEDAELGSRVLGIVLTRRDKEIPMAGFPQHKLEHYLGVLLRAGHRVAVCEQLEEPGPGKKLIRREVNRVVTPGTVTEDELLDPRRPNHLIAVCRSKQGVYGVAWADLSTGAFSAADMGEGQLPDELARLAAAECLLPDESAELLRPSLGPTPPRAVTPRPAWTFDQTTALDALKRHFQVATLTGFGFDDGQPCLAAAGALLLYLEETLKASLAHVRRLRPHRPDTFLVLDEVTRRSLELTRTLRDNLRDGSLLAVIDRTVTPMGARLLHDSLLAPLNDRAAIEARLDAVEELLHDHPLRGQLRELLDATSDLQRLTTRVSTARATPRDLAAVGRTLRLLPKFKAKLAGRKAPLLRELEAKLELCPDLRELLDRALADDPPYSAKDGGIVREGYSPELDELRKLAREGKDWIARYQAAEVTRTGITSLKVGFTDVMGYYIEITNANENRVPPDYIHERTLKNAKRYSTPRLKEYEEKVVTAQERSQALEFELFVQARDRVAAQTHRLLQTADVLATADFLAALAELAASRNYVRPAIVDEPVLAIRDGRHPVLEQTLPPGTFVPNDALLSPADGMFLLLTGPNMSGKCVRDDTLVFTDRGLVTAEELRPDAAPEGEFVPLGCRVRGRDGPATATHFYNGGVADTVLVETRYGFRLEGTPEHRVWVRRPDGAEGWARLGELRPGDRVAVERGADLWGTETRLRQPADDFHGNTIRYRLPEHLTPDLAYFMGLLVGDGTLTYPNYTVLSSGDEFIAREFARIADEAFGCPAVAKANGKDFVLASRLVREFLAVNDLGYHRAADKRVPRCVRAAPRAGVVAFLRGLFDTDGTAENRYGNVRLNTASPRLAREVQQLLLNLGVLATLGVKPTACLPSYQLNIDGEDAIRFHQLVGFRLPRKRERAKLCSAVRRPNKGGIPHLAGTLKAVQARIVATAGKPVALKRNKSVNSIFYTYIPGGRNLSYAKLGELVSYCHDNGVECPELDAILARGYFYDEVRRTSPGRGQVYDLSVPDGHAFVANGLVSHNSTFIRQIALLTLLAHVGSFVPARSATVGTADRIFTRVGASDELSRGQSTFMVEMTEAANILNNATSRSLVILDEIGRGTSTYDGVSLAWAITEHLHDTVGGRSLFATHYHELAQLAGSLPRMRNYTVQVQELQKEVVFLHKIAPGSADRSYGIHVARMAGVPEPVLKRAEEVLGTLECRQELKAPVACDPLPAPPAPPPPPAKPKRNGQPEPQVVSPPEAERPKRKAKAKAGPSLFTEGEASD